MSRMNDYEYEFVMDSIDKKVTARSARHARTHNGKGGTVKFPSDFMTKKEIKAMSGECIKYASLKKPMTWEEFKALPDDLKKEYIKYIRNKFGAPDGYIAEMLGVCGRTLSLMLTDLKCNAGKGSGNGHRKWEKEKFYAWRSGVDENAAVEAVVEPMVEQDVAVEENPDKVSDNVVSTKRHLPIVPDMGSMTFNNNDIGDVLETLRAMLGGVRVNCHFNWQVVDEQDPKED